MQVEHRLAKTLSPKTCETRKKKKNLLNFIFAKIRCEPKRDLNFTASLCARVVGNSATQWKWNVIFPVPALRLRLPCCRLILRNLRIVCTRVGWLFVGCSCVYSIRNWNTAFGVNFFEFFFFGCRRASKFRRSLFFLRLSSLCSQSDVIICLLAQILYLWWQRILLLFIAAQCAMLMANKMKFTKCRCHQLSHGGIN